jgi:hypothetical protein
MVSPEEIWRAGLGSGRSIRFLTSPQRLQVARADTLLPQEKRAFFHTLDKALMRNFAEMDLCAATVSITARGRDALSKIPLVRPRTSPRIREDKLRTSPSGNYPDGRT